MVAMVKLLELDLEVNGTTCYHVLYFEVGEFYRVTNILDSLHVELRGLFTIDLTLCSSNYHFSILEY